MREPMGKAALENAHIIETILPGISVRRSGGDSIVRHSALLQVEQRILKSPQASQRGRHSAGNLGGVSAAHLARQRRALDAQHMR